VSVWDVLVGQSRVVERLQATARDAREVLAGRPAPAMTHAWLITGPPGSGRSNAALAFAAALQCEDPGSPGCGHCHACRTVLERAHGDVRVIASDTLSLGVGDVRRLVLVAQERPINGRWTVILVEQADRLTDEAANALLKTLEEPPPRTVWLLCAPTTEDVLPTVRSRCRPVGLAAPPPAAIAALLVSEGVDASMAAFAARASLGHVGRARGLARDEATRLRRADVLRLPLEVETVGGCIVAAANLVEVATSDAEAAHADREEREREGLQFVVGDPRELRGRSRGATSAFKSLGEDQKRRRTRTVRDSLDRAFIDLVAFYRDVLTVQLGADVALVNVDVTMDVQRLARTSSPESTLHRIDAVLAARTAIDGNVAPLLAVEAMTLALRAG
jgi:DNA polymerase III subunit delta'